MSAPDHEMLRMCSENVSLGCTVFGSAKTDLGKPRNASLCKKRTKSAPGQEGVNWLACVEALCSRARESVMYVGTVLIPVGVKSCESK